MGSYDTDRVATAMSTPVVLRSLSREEQLAVQFSKEDLARGLELEKLCTGIQFAIPGVPSVYYGDEQGMQGTNDPFNRMPFKMGDGELQAYYAELCYRRNNEPAIREGEAEFAAVTKDLLLVYRGSELGSDWLIAANRSEHDIDFSAEFGNMCVSCVAPALKTSYIELKKDKQVC